MLQPLQLEELSAHHAAAIAELRDFLAKAGIPVGTAAALHAIPERLQGDRAFHRDLTSHLWVLMENEAGQNGTSHGRVLGILAVAAAGPQLAAQADADDAHSLLRFVMAARRSLEGLPADAFPERAAAPTAQGFPKPQEAPPAVSPDDLPLRKQPLSPKGEAAPPPRRAAWIAAICALLVLAAAGVWLWLRPLSQDRHVPAPIVSAPATEQQQPSASPKADTGVGQGTAQSAPQRRVIAASPLRRSGAGATRSASPAAAPANIAADSRGSSGHIDIPAPVAPRTTATNSVSPAARPGGKISPVPSSTLSRRLGSPAMPSYAPAENEAVTRKHPRLLRRVPDSAALRENDDTLLAEADPTDAPNLPSNRTASAANTRVSGTVRPASLGTMAANVMYTPVPPYPAEASAAGVQGEVRVQARIDPSGNVASARVISGPPLLRDAALNAVQHWRYKPLMASGRATATSTVAVVDFELP